MHRIIYNELCLTEVRNESRQIYRNIITGLAEAGAEGIVLGCTEIELLVSATDSPVPVFPTTRLHVEAAVEFSLTTLKRLTPHGPGASHTRILNCDSNARCLRHEHASGVPPCPLRHDGGGAAGCGCSVLMGRFALLDERLGAQDDSEFKPVGVLGSGLGRVSHDPEVVTGDDESVAVERDPADRRVLDDLVP